ncbi:hypothetical protein ANN_17515 [Periplaneta americana]|uniref:Uncharacterized protein n=1 Tax=Periplaneta americana TaxID=6978 RepID=A0ABQ8SU35_PERAM|nr:hypothetical protein ANN_17515 [Periplaneta americana]
MAGLCEGGNEPSGSLKAICNNRWRSVKSVCYHNLFRTVFCAGKSYAGYLLSSIAYGNIPQHKSKCSVSMLTVQVNKYFTFLPLLALPYVSNKFLHEILRIWEKLRRIYYVLPENGPWGYEPYYSFLHFHNKTTIDIFAYLQIIRKSEDFFVYFYKIRLFNLDYRKKLSGDKSGERAAHCMWIVASTVVVVCLHVKTANTRHVRTSVVFRFVYHVIPSPFLHFVIIP